MFSSRLHLLEAVSYKYEFEELGLNLQTIYSVIELELILCELLYLRKLVMTVKYE